MPLPPTPPLQGVVHGGFRLRLVAYNIGRVILNIAPFIIITFVIGLGGGASAPCTT